MPTFSKFELSDELIVYSYIQESFNHSLPICLVQLIFHHDSVIMVGEQPLFKSYHPFCIDSTNSYISDIQNASSSDDSDVHHSVFTV